MLSLLIIVIVIDFEFVYCACSTQTDRLRCASEIDCPGECRWTGSACACFFICPGNVSIKEISLPCTTGACCDTATCQLQPPGFVCRANVSDCDIAETCTGSSPTCGFDFARPRGTVCRASKGLCDAEEVCDGRSACPPDVLHPRDFPCRARGGECDVSERCSGVDAQCPPDAKAPTDQLCAPSKAICDAPEYCDGLTNFCPPDAFLPATHVCRPPMGACDVPETCDGVGLECPVDKFAPAGTKCRLFAVGNTCDVIEECGNNSAKCPPDGFLPVNTPCDDGSRHTTNDLCDSKGVCSGKCIADMACDDRNKCTEDTCTVELGRCRFTPIQGCVPESTPAPPTNCLLDKSFRFDFLERPGDDADVVPVCFFKVSLTPINGINFVRTFAFGSKNSRALSFGIVPRGDDGSSAEDAKIRAATAVEMRFPLTWTSAIESVTVSSIGIDTVLAVVRGTAESERANIDLALQAFDDSGSNSTLTNGVWLILNPGEHRAPPAIALSRASSWTVMHLRGRPFSLDAVQLTRPVNSNGAEWQAAPDGVTTVLLQTTTPPPDSAADGPLVSIVVGSVIGGLLLLCGTFAAGMWWSRRRGTRVAETKSNPADAPQRAQYASISVLPQNQNDYEMLQIAPKLPGTEYADGSELTSQNHQ
jgi:hypothetical protein